MNGSSITGWLGPMRGFEPFYTLHDLTFDITNFTYFLNTIKPYSLYTISPLPCFVEIFYLKLTPLPPKKYLWLLCTVSLFQCFLQRIVYFLWAELCSQQLIDFWYCVHIVLYYRKYSCFNYLPIFIRVADQCPFFAKLLWLTF